MREGKYESSGTVGTALTFLLIGLGAGAVIGMLFSPKEGRHIRRGLRRQYDNARETFGDWGGNARDFADDVIERGSDFADDLRERVSPFAKQIKWRR
jgi:gas vesicle protein